MTPTGPTMIEEPASSTSRRIVAFVAIAVVLAGLGVVERVTGGDGGGVEVGAVEPRTVAPVGGPPGALGTTWFCAAGTASEDGVADHTVVIANPTQAAVTARVTAFPGTLAGDANAAEVTQQGFPTQTVDVAALSRVSVRLADLVDAPFAAALVEVDAGEVAVDHVLTGADIAAGPCASSASTDWYFATGATTRDARQILTLFNPFPETAVVEMSFSVAQEGGRRPNEFQGFPVPGRSLVAVDIGAVVTRYHQVATSVRARSGRLVVERIQTFDGSEGPRGMDVSLGAPRPSGLWYYPEGLTGDGLTEVYTVYNPSDEDEAQVDLEVALDDPATNGAVQPFEISVAPRAAVQVVMNSETRVPAGIAHSVTVRSANGVPVVAERFVSAVSPSTRSGIGYTIGSPVVATSWILAAGQANAEMAEVLVLQNPSSDTIAHVRVTAIAGGQRLPVDQLQDLEVPQTGRLAVDLGAYINRDDLALVVEADVPIVVERGLFRVGSRGLSLAPGVAAFDGAIVPDPEVVR
ncbi:MAG: hypothetical protein ACRD0U_20375 [Acidimicrobiales bacterium]